MTAPSPTLPERKPDGGPAFPFAYKDLDSGLTINHGMTMRQWYAGMALQGLLSCDRVMAEIDETSKRLNATPAEEAEVQPKVLAKTAFLIAEAMIAAEAG